MTTKATARAHALMDYATEQFNSAMHLHGLIPPVQLITNGKLHRFASNGKHGDDAGWYIYYDGDIPAGAFGCWRLGIVETWRADIGRQPTPKEEAAHKERMQSIRRAQEQEKKARHAEAKAKAKNILNNAPLADDGHDYLRLKNVKTHGLHGYNGDLIVPASDIVGEVQTLQFISADGAKRFLPGGQVRGCFYLIGEPSDLLCIAEGFATAATIHEATGYPVATAFNAGNLQTVAQAFRQKYPDMCIIVCADDDWKTAGNPGLTKGTEAARAVGGHLVFPSFDFDRHEKATDFNDLAALYGLENVNCTIIAVTNVTNVHATDYAGSTVTADVTTSKNGVTQNEKQEVPCAAARPCFQVFDDWYKDKNKKYRPGVWYFTANAASDNASPIGQPPILGPAVTSVFYGYCT